MSRITITLHIDIPDGARVQTPDVDYVDDGTARVSVTEEPPHVAEFPPIGSRSYDPDERAQGTVQREAAPLCQHGIPMKRWPAGVNKAGKPFNASWRPSDANCTTKPVWDRDAAA